MRSTERFRAHRETIFGVLDAVGRPAWVFESGGYLVHRVKGDDGGIRPYLDDPTIFEAARQLASDMEALILERRAPARRSEPQPARLRLKLGSKAILLEGSIVGCYSSSLGPLLLVTARPGEASRPLDPDGRGPDEACIARYRLTPRQREVGLLLSRRMTDREIANRLQISVHTARHHTERVLAKLGVQSRRKVRDRLFPVVHGEAGEDTPGADGEGSSRLG